MPELNSQNKPIVIIGAGPAGCVAAALLKQKGHEVIIVERQRFPRFSIGESLLPQCMEFLQEANLLQDIVDNAERYHFNYKNGAAFYKDGQYSEFDFRKKFTPGPGTTYQVRRADFDHQLAKSVEAMNIPIFWEHTVIAFDNNSATLSLTINNNDNETISLEPAFVFDASGFGRVLPRLLNLDKPSSFPSRTSLFTHVEDRIDNATFDRDKIRITVHPQHNDVWYWLIPFSNGRSSIGVVAENHFINSDEKNLQMKLRQFIHDEPNLRELLGNAIYDTPAQETTGYACDVTSLWGNGFALLGNAGEFLDPVFSSGVTIAMKSASLAANALNKQVCGHPVDWEVEYAQPLRAGVDTFRVFVEAWYDGRFQDIVFAPQKSKEVKAMISSILAGYAWDTNNPYVKESSRRVQILAELCKAQ